MAVKLIRFQNDRHDVDGEYELLGGKEALEARTKFFDEVGIPHVQFSFLRG